jgi:hypothetical protein
MATLRERKLKLPVPTTIITGGLGSGKTTLLRHLVAHKPPGGGRGARAAAFCTGAAIVPIPPPLDPPPPLPPLAPQRCGPSW